MLMSFDVRFIDKSLSDHCGATNSCAHNLRILTKSTGMSPTNKIRKDFHKFYANQLEMTAVDVFVCFHPASMCELYMPFNRSIIVIASTRYELGRFKPNEWKKWNSNLKIIAENPRNLIAANNLYDAEYIRYFTGLNVTLLPSFCKYTNVQYNPQRDEFLLAPIHHRYFESTFLKLLNHSINQFSKKKIIVARIRDIYRYYRYSDLANHSAIIHVPYQVSIMSLFEQYQMGIPLIFPSLNLLTEWHYKFGVVNERSWDNVNYGKKCNASNINGVFSNIPDPNNDFDRNAIKYWLNFSDFYQWPHIIYYESFDDLVHRLHTTDFNMISVKMKIYSSQVKQMLLEKWRGILTNIKKNSNKFH